MEGSMKNWVKIVLAIVILIAIIAVVVVAMNSKKGNATKLGEIGSAKDLETIIEKVYEGNEELPGLQTQEVDITDNTMVQAFTGLESGKDLEYLVVSEPLMSSQAYSFVLAKVKDGVDANQVAKDMSEKIDTRKWICVSAEKLYATNSGNVVCLVMSNEEWAKPVYEKFKELAGEVGKEYTKEEEPADLPPEMY